MAIEFRCFVCGKGFVVDEKHIGRKTICKACGTTLQVPESGEPLAIIVDAAAPRPEVPSPAASSSEVESPPATPLMPSPLLTTQPPRKLIVRDPQLLAAISQHIETHIGPIARIFRDQVNERQQVDIFWVKPSEGRPFHTLITCGMAEQPMNAPNDAEDRAYAELILSLPQAWPIEDVALRNEANYWPLRWMKFAARFPHDNHTFLAEKHILPNGAPPQPFHPRTLMAGWLFTTPLMLPTEVGSMTMGEHSVHFLSMLPLHAEELHLHLQQGPEELLKRLTSEFGSRELLSMRRRSVCKAVYKTRRTPYVGKGIVTHCKCGSKESAPLDLAGSTISCIQCGEPVYVPCSSQHTDGAPTAAAQPAGVRMNLGTFLIHQPVELIMPIAAVLAITIAILLFLLNLIFDYQPGSIQAAELSPLAILVAGALFIGGSAWRYRHWRDQFQEGNLCPAMVISTNPPLLAVFTDMATGRAGAQKVIKIIPHGLKQIGGQTPQVGQKVATASFYYGDANEPRWEDFVPVPIQYATDEPAAADYALAAIDPNDWRELELGLQQLPQAKQRGYYWIQGWA